MPNMGILKALINNKTLYKNKKTNPMYKNANENNE